MARIDTDLLGLQIVSKEDASLLGEVDALIIDDAARKVAGFLVDLGVYEASVLPFSEAAAVGADAIIVESARSLSPITSHPELEALAKKEITITDAKAITLSGRSVGILGDFFIDTDTGDIAGVEFIASDISVYPRETAVIPASSIHRLGRDIVVLKEDYNQHLLRGGTSLERIARPYEYGETVNGAPTEAVAGRAPLVEAVPAEPELAPETVEPEVVEPETVEPEVVEPETVEPEVAEPETIEPEVVEPEPVFVPEAQAPPVGVPTEEAPTPEAEVAPIEEPPAPETGEAAVKPEAETPLVEPADDTFTSEQKHFLIGKRVLRRIEGPSGEVVAEQGDIVDYEMIQKAKTSDMLLILSLNVE